VEKANLVPGKVNRLQLHVALIVINNHGADSVAKCACLSFSFFQCFSKELLFTREIISAQK